MLGDLFKAVADTNSLEAWTLLFIFPACVMRPYAQRRGGRRRRRYAAEEHADLCMRRMAGWETGAQVASWQQAQEECAAAALQRSHSRRHTDAAAQQRANVRKAKSLAREGRAADAVKALTSTGHAAETASTLQALRSKFPSAAPPALPRTADPVPYEFTAEEVLAAVQSFPTASAGGCIGLKPQHLKEVTACTAITHTCTYVVAQLTRVVNMLAAGAVAEAIMDVIAGAPLYALAKKAGGIRPVAVGETLRRIVSKCCMRVCRQPAAEELSPSQLAVGVPGGTEALIHAAAAAVAVHGSSSDMVMLKVDFANAFGNADRSTMLTALHSRSKLNGAYRWVKACYQRRSLMWYGDISIDCTAGVQQGDPLGPLLFCLCLAALVELLQERVGALALNAWLMDDGTLIGSTDDVQHALKIITGEGPALGLHINLPKCELWWPTPNPRMHEFPRDITRVLTAGVTLLGSTIGSAAFAADDFGSRVARMASKLQLLSALEDPQIQLQLLRTCLGMPTLVYSLRTQPPASLQPQLEIADAAIAAALEDIACLPLPPSARQQAALPVKCSGLGIRKAADAAPAAFLSSVFASQALRDRALRSRGCLPPGVDAALALLQSQVGDLPVMIQQQWTAERMAADLPTQEALLVQVDKQSFVSLKAAASPVDQARLLSCSMSHAGAWQLALPFPSMQLQPREFSTAVCLWLGLPVYPSEMDRCCPECKQVALDPLGHHSLSCSATSDRASRHDTLRDEIACTCRRAALSAVKEQQHLISGSRARPGDVTIANWQHGRTCAFDVTVWSCVLDTHVRAGAAQRRGYTAQQAELHKDSRALQTCLDAGLDFTPLAVEVFGGWGQAALKTFNTLAGMLSQRTGRSKSEEVTYLYQRLSICLMRDNVRMIQQRAPDFT